MRGAWGVGEIAPELAVERPLGFHDQFAEIASGAAPSRTGGLPVGVLLDQVMGVLHGHRQADAPEDRQIHHVVPDIRGMRRFEAEFIAESLEDRQLVELALEDVANAQVLHPVLDHGGGAAGDDGDVHSGHLQHLHAMPVAGVEGLVLLPVVAEEQTAVGEYAVDVEDHQAYLGGAL